MGIVLLVFGLLALCAGIVYLILSLKKCHKVDTPTLGKTERNSFLLSLAGIGLGGGLTQSGIQLLNNWQEIMPWYSQMMAILGGGLLMFSIGLFVIAFFLRYYRKGLSDEFRRKNLIVFIVSILAVFLSFILFEEGACVAWGFPLPSGFRIDGNGFALTYPNEARSGFVLAWYGVLILTGFVVAYFICDHKFYQKFGKHGILENCLIVVFIFGILGARIWYVVGNWNGDGHGVEPFSERVARGDILSIFAAWEGGLTIMGGVIAGIVSGWIYLKLFRKYVPITFALDVVVPSILIAQVIGRWGNFFNHEVYGGLVNVSDGWWWLPTFIQKEMGVGLNPGQIYVPLFLVEGIINLIGYFLIAHGLPALWDFLWHKFGQQKKERGIVRFFERAPGVLAGLYLIFYGTARMILEPLRDPNYNMGTNGMWSFWNAMVYIILGVVLIVLLQIYEVVWRPKLEERKALRAAKAGAASKDTPSEEKPIQEEVEQQAPASNESAEEPKEEAREGEEDGGDFFIVHKKSDDSK